MDEFFGKDLFLATIIASLVVPLQMSLIPILTVYNDIGNFLVLVQNLILGVWLAHTGFGLALTTFLLRNFIKSLPHEMIEAARVDGANPLSIFLKKLFYHYLFLLLHQFYFQFCGFGMICWSVGILR